jgi:hypothetical protein
MVRVAQPLQVGSEAECRNANVMRRPMFLFVRAPWADRPAVLFQHMGERGRTRNRLDVGAYRCADVAVRNRQNQLRPSSPFRPVDTWHAPAVQRERRAKGSFRRAMREPRTAVADRSPDDALRPAAKNGVERAGLNQSKQRGYLGRIRMNALLLHSATSLLS